MPIEKILEFRYKPSSIFGTNAKLRLIAHCSCGKDFKIRERFPEKYLGSRDYTRAKKCPSCKKVTYLDYTITTKQHSSGFNVTIANDLSSNGD